MLFSYMSFKRKQKYENIQNEINRVKMKLLITAETEETNNEQKASYGNFI